jgi:hypothetical protein
MSLISLLIILVVIGVVIWAVTSFIPMEPKIAMLIRVVGILVALFYILQAFGVLAHFRGVQVPSVN